MSWDETLAIRNDWKSLSAHPVQDPMAYEADGTEHTLRQYAEAMIAVSGNTGADHLLMHLGRERVEATLAEMGHVHPEMNRPLLATRELFALDVAVPTESVETYVQAEEAERRALLDATVRPVDVAPVQAIDWVVPRNLESVGWFASATDLGQAMVELWTMAEEPGLTPIQDILVLSPGIDPSLIDAESWSYIGHKGGALPGGLNRTWLLERSDGRRFVFVVTLNNPRAPLDLVTPDAVLAGAFVLLAARE